MNRMMPASPLRLALAFALGTALQGAIGAEPAPSTSSAATAPEVADSAPVATPSGKARRSARKRATPALETAAPNAGLPNPPSAAAGAEPPPAVPGTERVLFSRAPIKVVLEARRERRLYLPWETALQVPQQADGLLDAQIIGSTLYLTAQPGLGPVRLIAEGLGGEGMIPLDLVVREHAPGVPDELEISLAASSSSKKSGNKHPSSRNDDEKNEENGDDAEDEVSAPDLVQLTRYCSQMLYAPQRLIHTPPGVRSIDVRITPVAGLYRGARVITTPIGAWHSTDLFVTAVRFTNRTADALELDMEQLRGHWVAATPQHYRLGAAGTETDTTAVCLISDQPFDAVRP